MNGCRLKAPVKSALNTIAKTHPRPLRMPLERSCKNHVKAASVKIASLPFAALATTFLTNNEILPRQWSNPTGPQGPSTSKSGGPVKVAGRPGPLAPPSEGLAELDGAGGVLTEGPDPGVYLFRGCS